MIDNLALFEKHDAEQEEYLNSQPACSVCGEHIQEDCYYDIGGAIYCESCIDDCKKWKE